MRAAAVQLQSTNDTDRNLEAADRLTRAAAADGAELVVLPERLDLRGSAAPAVPADLTTGCYVLRDEVPGVEACEGRSTHAALNQDLG